MTRRSLLGVLGVGAGIAAAAFGTAERVAAADSDKAKDTQKKKKAPPKEEADSD